MLCQLSYPGIAEARLLGRSAKYQAALRPPSTGSGSVRDVGKASHRPCLGVALIGSLVTTDIGWRELGWGMVLAGAILLAISLVVDAGTGKITSAGILIGGVLAVAYEAKERRTGS